ncbi:hypothetical protein CYMTET_19563 [Cymbomonas tetramitiformis]|uniref:Protein DETOXIFICATION n=1 Tax=Cymbomonas tetramitiformis TaxID=36881 RepID=A0AAE0G5U1_9CHLO|nr:hypothetical protein CYMTET_19563 [Cymbomonas tetramitiformis]
MDERGVEFPSSGKFDVNSTEDFTTENSNRGETLIADGPLPLSDFYEQETETPQETLEGTIDELGYTAEMLLCPGVGLDRRIACPEDVSKFASTEHGQNLARLGSGHVGGDGSVERGKLVQRKRVSSDTHSGKTPQGLGDSGVPPRESDPTEPVLTPVTFSQIIAFAVPALGAVLADPVMSLIDTACVGQISSVHLAALGPNTTVFGFAAMVFSFLGTATTGMVARAHDQGKPAQVSRVVSLALLLAVVCGVLASGVLLTFQTQILQLLNTSTELMKPAAEYLVVRALGLPAMLISFVGFSSCLGRRDSATPLKVAGISGVFNLVVDLYLVLGPPKAGIFGAAVATVGAQVLAAAVYLFVLSRNINLAFRLPSWSDIKPFVSTGGVLTLRSVCVMTSLSLMTTKAAALGTIPIAAHQVLVGVLTVAQFCPEPLSQCAQTFLASTAARVRGGTSSAEETAFTKHTGRLLLTVALSLGAILSAGCALLVAKAPTIFTSDVLVSSTVSFLSPLLGAVCGLYTLVCVTDGLIFASGDMLYASAVQIINLPLVAGLLTAAQHMEMALPGIWAVLLVLQICRLIQNGSRIYRQYA